MTDRLKDYMEDVEGAFEYLDENLKIIEDPRGLIPSLSTEIKYLSKEIDMTIEEIDDLNTELSKLRNEITKLQEANFDLEATVDNLRERNMTMGG